jgi:hypothetical protein
MKGKDAQTKNDSVFSEEELAQFDEEALQGFRVQSMLTPESSSTVSNAKNPKGGNAQRRNTCFKSYV